MNIAIIDDTATDRILLSYFLERYLLEHHFQNFTHITEFESGEDFFESYQHTTFDMVFVDYYMYGMSGMDVAKRIRSLEDSCAIFFTTATPDYAVESFLVKASGYLLKPYKYEDFCKLLGLCDILKNFIANPYVDYPDGKNHNIRVFLSDLIFCNSTGHYINAQTQSRGALRIRSSFDAFTTPLLEYPQFLVSSRGWLINMDYVETIDKCDFIMKDHSHVPITKKSKTEIKGIYEKYLFSKMALG